MARFSATQRLQVLQTPVVRGWSVEQTCEFYGISPASFYRWRARFDAGGLEGLEERSRRPRSSPTRVDGDLESTIVQWRQTHGWGARRIRDQLRLDGRETPAVSTIHAVLIRNGLVAPRTPGQAATIRFERSCPNDLWQLDATEWVLADDRTVYVMDIIDDHSRFLVASRAVAQLSEDNAWTTLHDAISSHGPPRQLLTDNASWLTGRSFDSVVDFERRCWRLQIDTIHCAPYHPETLGKLERQHRTLKDWLRQRPEATTVAQLQTLLDTYRQDYNTSRPHQGIDGHLPADRYAATPKTAPSGPPPTIEMTRKVTGNGTVVHTGWNIHVGRRWAGRIVTLIEHDDKLTITHADRTLAAVALDRDLYPNRYISTGRLIGRPPS